MADHDGQPGERPDDRFRGRVLRVFVSSPGDLGSEREAIKQVIGRLSREFEPRGLRIEPLLWEPATPRIMGYPPQELVNYYLGHASDADVFVCMLWSRLGSEAVVHGERHPSGTLYELRDAYSKWRKHDRPLILVFRCQRPAPLQAEAQQTAAVEEFFRSGIKRETPELGTFVTSFTSTEDFASQAELSLRAIAEKALDSSPAPRALGHREFARLLDGIEQFLDSYDESQVRGRDGIEGMPLTWQELRPDGTAETLPDRPLVEHFDQRGQRLALIGAEGRGKTFAMRRLMRDLAFRARRRGGGMLPIYFNLASWSETRGSSSGIWSITSLWRVEADDQSLDGWLVDELVRRYDMSRAAASRLVSNRQLIVCLDGLDELRTPRAEESDDAAALRRSCVRQINALLADQSVAMILCCREQTYREMDLKPELGNPLRVEALSDEQARLFVQRFADLDGLTEAIKRSDKLRERARTPLFLEYMCVAYTNMSTPAILAAAELPHEQWEKHLLDHYVSARLAIADKQSVSKPLINRCLGWLARRDDSDFLIEDLQPDALSVHPGRVWTAQRSMRAYSLLSGGLLAGYLGLCVSVPAAVANLIEWSALATFREGAFSAARLACIAFFATLIGTFAAFRTTKWWVFGLVTGTIFALVRGVDLWSTPPHGLGGTLAGAVEGTLVTWPCAVLVFGLFGHYSIHRIVRHRQRYPEKPGIELYEIQPLESFEWHWIDPGERWRGGWAGLIAGPVVGGVFWAGAGAARAVAFGLIATAFVTLFAGLSGTGLRVSYQPNQGIIRSARHATLMALFFACVSAVACVTAYGAVHGTVQAVVNGVLGLASAFTFLAFGGIPVIRHVCLGWLLSRQGNLPSWTCFPPWRGTVEFLDQLVRFKLLRRSAGGYVFRHDSLRRYFRALAERAEASPTDSPRADPAL